MQLKSLIRYPIDIRRARRLLEEKSTETSGLDQRPVALDLRTPNLLFDCGRHLASLAYYSRAAGSPFYVRGGDSLLAGIVRKFHGHEMLAQPHARWLSPGQPLPADALVLCDDDGRPAQGHVQMLIGRDIDRDYPVMPYPMHPWTLRHLDQCNLAQLRETTDRRGIFFAGNQKRKYGGEKMLRNFGILSRMAMLDALRDRFPNRVTANLDDGSISDPIVIADNRITSIAPRDWLPALARARFFLCCPGASQPTCHNLIESMSVGTIPIIEYGDRVTPELSDGENAICFRGERGLLEAIERIDRLSPERLSQLHRNVAAFYDKFLCGKRFLGRLRDQPAESTPGGVCMPFHESNFYPSYRSAAA